MIREGNDILYKKLAERAIEIKHEQDRRATSQFCGLGAEEEMGDMQLNATANFEGLEDKNGLVFGRLTCTSSKNLKSETI